MAKEFTNDKVVNEMTRNGLQEHNLTTGTVNRVSKRFEDYSYSDKGSSGEAFRKTKRNDNVQKRHSMQQKHYHRKFEKNLSKKERDIQHKEKYVKQVSEKETQMRKKKHLGIEQARKYNYKAYGEPELYRTRDLAVTRGVRNAGKIFFRRAEAMYFQGDEDNMEQKIFHDSYLIAKYGKRHTYSKISHPVHKLRNASYLHTKEKLAGVSQRASRHGKRAEKYRFKLEMETAWQKEMRINKDLQQTDKKRKWIKKIQFKRMYKKKYEQAFVQNVKNQFIKIVRRTAFEIVKRIKTLLVVGAVLLLLGVLFYACTSVISMVSTMGVDGVTQLAAGLYVTGFDNITACDEYFSKLLNELQITILDIEKNNPDYDEYQYWVNGLRVKDAEEMVGYIKYDQISLASYLSTMIPEYNLETAMPLMDNLFVNMFILEQEEVIELRKRAILNEDGTPELNTDGSVKEEEYECHIWKTALTTLAITDIVKDLLTEDEYSQYDTFCKSEGNLKIYGSPLALDWHTYISSSFGWRNHPIEGKKKQHKGIDIAVPTGTKIYSVMDGKVQIAGYSESAGNWIVIEDKDGYVSKYMHCNSLMVASGAEVKRGQLIATVGSTGHSTGPHLHLQIEDNMGTPINPLFICVEYGEEVQEQK